MSTALYPGTFDPITFGHIDIAIRAARIFSRVVAVVAQNPEKNPLFSINERLDMVKASLLHVPSIEVIGYGGLIVNCVKEYQASAIIRGLRALTDFESEFQMAYTNRKLYDAAETVFFMPSARYTYFSSTMVKQVARLGGDITQFVPEYVQEKLHLKLDGRGAAAVAGTGG